MIVSNTFFYLIWELRRWKEQLGKVAILIIGFSLLCTLLSLAITSGKELLNGKPPWINDNKHYVTIANQHITGELSPVNKLTLLAAKQQPYVTEVSWFSINGYQLSFRGKAPLNLTALWFSKELVHFLNIDNNLKDQLLNERGVWISHKLWQEQYNGQRDIIGTVVTNNRLPEGIVVRGILPEQLNEIGTWSPDIWLSGSYLNYKTPFSSDNMIEKFLLAAPLYYGVAETTSTIDVDSLFNALSNKKLTINSMDISGNGSQLKIFDQVNFDPQAIETLYFQFKLLILLIISLAIVLGMNTFTLYSTQAITYREEYRLQRILGSKNSSMLTGPFLLTLLFVLIIFLLSVPLMLLLNEIISSQNLYRDATVQGLKVSIFNQISSLTLVSVIFLISVGFNAMTSFSGSLFNRAMNTSNSTTEKIISQSLLTIQMTIAIIALSILISLYWSIISSAPRSPINENIKTLSVNLNGQYVNPVDLTAGNVSNVKRNTVALSKEPFTQPALIETSLSSANHSDVFKVHYVSQNYFNVLGIKIPDIDTHKWASGVIVNQRANEVIKRKIGTLKSVGMTLKVGIEERSYRVEGVVDNLPHLGIYGGVDASIYLPFNESTNQNLHLYARSENENDLLSAKNWLTANSTRTVTHQSKPLSDIVSKKDSLHIYMLSFCSLLVTIIIVAVILSLNFQLKARLKIEKQELGVLLALGAPNKEIIKIFILGFIIPMLIALPLATSLIYGIGQFLSSYNASFGTINIHAILFSSLILVLLLLAISSIQASLFFRVPIYSHLRSN